MIAANHFMNDTADGHMGALANREISIGALVRGFTRLIAVSLLASAVGLWIMPGASNLPELMMMKLCASFFFGLTGVHLLFAARAPKGPQTS